MAVQYMKSGLRLSKSPSLILLIVPSVGKIRSAVSRSTFVGANLRSKSLTRGKVIRAAEGVTDNDASDFHTINIISQHSTLQLAVSVSPSVMSSDCIERVFVFLLCTN
jgi:hypothetical protein